MLLSNMALTAESMVSDKGILVKRLVTIYENHLKAMVALHNSTVWPFSSPEPTILLACGKNRELREQPFRTCAIYEG